MAQCHASGFDASWDCDSFARLLQQAGVIALGVWCDSALAGFIVVRCVADEAEILTFVVLPALRGKKLGRDLLEASLQSAAAHGTRVVHLEVAQDNAAARALYARAGFCESGRRKGYYRKRDAVMMQRTLYNGCRK